MQLKPTNPRAFMFTPRCWERQASHHEAWMHDAVKQVA